MPHSSLLDSVYPRNHGNNKSPQLREVALEHAGMLHPDEARGRVSIAHATPHGWRERSYRIDQLPDVIAALAGETDAYISQQRFECKRVIAQLWQLGAMYVDLDYHQIGDLRDQHPLGVLEDVLIALEKAQKPAPTLAIFSGRGIYVVWLHSPVPRMVLPRWNRCQRELYQVLRPFGADRGALDAARVLRISGTINSKSGAVVEQIAPPGEVWDFEDLSREILPVERGELKDLRVQRAVRRPSERFVVPPEGFNEGTLWAGRLGDLQRLRGIRWLGEVPPGERDTWMFLAGVAMSWIAIPPVLRRELWELAKEAASWSDEESSRRLSAIMKRSHMAARGERVEWPPGSGRMVDARYHYTNQRIIEDLGITSDEEADMNVIISKDTARKRDRERKKRERRAAGAADRFAIAAHNRAEVLRMSLEGKSVSHISDTLRLSQIRVKEIRRSLRDEGMLNVQIPLDKGDSQGGMVNVRLYGGVAYPEGVSTEGFGESADLEGEAGAQPKETQPRPEPPPSTEGLAIEAERSLQAAPDRGAA